MKKIINGKFQFTHPCGMRHFLYRYKKARKHFNSRIHAECGGIDIIYRQPVPHFNSRIHAECGGGLRLIVVDYFDFNSRIHAEFGGNI